MSEEQSTQTADAESETSAEPAVEPAEELETHEKETVRVDHSTPRLSALLATVAAFVGVALSAPFNVLAAPFGVGGLVIVAGSLFLRDSRGYLSLGVGLALLGTIITGAYGALPPALMLVAVSALLIAWDVGQHGLSIGQQLGRDTRTSRLELVHAGVTTLAIAVVDIVAFAVFQFAGGGRPASAVTLVVIGAIVLIWTLRR